MFYIMNSFVYLFRHSFCKAACRGIGIDEIVNGSEWIKKPSLESICQPRFLAKGSWSRNMLDSNSKICIFITRLSRRPTTVPLVVFNQHHGTSMCSWMDEHRQYKATYHSRRQHCVSTGWCSRVDSRNMAIDSAREKQCCGYQKPENPKEILKTP